MDGLTKLLLTKYRPELLQEPVAVTKNESSSAQGPTPRSAPETIHASTGVVLIMSSAEFSDSVIFKALNEFNHAHPNLMSRSFTLPIAMYGLPQGSWVYLPPKDDQ